jgi:transposase-like protein
MEENTAKNKNATDFDVPPTEVKILRARRRYTPEYKKRILEKLDRCKQPGEIGALLRKEGLYSSSITKWRRERADSGLDNKTTSSESKVLLEKIRHLEHTNQKLEKRLERAEAIIEVQKKIVTMYGSEEDISPNN